MYALDGKRVWYGWDGYVAQSEEMRAEMHNECIYAFEEIATYVRDGYMRYIRGLYNPHRMRRIHT